ncbi:MAG: sensor domain-containing diguanylate cyclase [Erysipelothrix sp.]|nr:sensor domain-containing diguanylate cyclase [Erysipelothrix sp.]
MNYKDVSVDQLIVRIEELERLNRQLLKEVNECNALPLSTVENLGHWYLDLTNGRATFNDKKINILGYTKDELPEFVHYSFFTNKLHKEDYDATMNSMIKAMHDDCVHYEYTYRIQAKDGTYRWFYDLGKVVERDQAGKATLVAGIVFDVTTQKESEVLLKNQNQQLLERVMYDELTGLRSRTSIFEELKFHLNKNVSNTHVLSIAMVDIDDFKAINDTYGHLVGDAILKKIGEIIHETIRGFDVAGRYGGEEFLLLFPNTSLTQAHRATQRILDRISQTIFDEVGHVTLSGGVVEHSNETLEDLIELADQKLYEAKKAGKNQVTY